MEQHAVPQPITSYEFRLVGDMTLKQFGKLAFGVILALIVYGINPPPGILKWSLIAIFTGLGAGMAFLPFQGRPLDTWILSFFKRIYSPTQYVWRMGGQSIIEPSYETAPNPPITAQPSVSQPSPQIHIPNDHVTDETNTIQRSTVSVDPMDSLGDTPQPVTQTISSSPWHEGKLAQPVIPTPVQPEKNEVDDTLYVSTDLPQTPPNTQQPTGPIATGKTTIYSADSPYYPITNHRSLITDNRATVPPAFNPSLVIPTLPNIPNILGGFVKNTEGKLVEGAIIEVRDASLNPVRAFKTNQLGQFQIATSLPNGIYEIETEKDGLAFDIIKLELTGEILPPFEIIAKPSVVV